MSEIAAVTLGWSERLAGMFEGQSDDPNAKATVYEATGGWSWWAQVSVPEKAGKGWHMVTKKQNGLARSAKDAKQAAQDWISNTHTAAVEAKKAALGR